MPHCDNFLVGDAVRHITGEGKPKTTVGGLPYAFCIPLTTKELFYNVVAAREEQYLELERITLDGPEFKELKSLGISMGDGVYNLISGNTAILIRFQTRTRNDFPRGFGCAFVSTESGWVVESCLAAFQRLAMNLFGQPWNKPFLEWYVIDDGPGLFVFDNLKEIEGQSDIQFSCMTDTERLVSEEGLGKPQAKRLKRKLKNLAI